MGIAVKTNCKDCIHAVALTIEKVNDLLLKYDLAAYEKEFGELEEA